MASLLNLINLSSSRFKLNSRDPSLRLEIESFREHPQEQELYVTDCVRLGDDEEGGKEGMCITWEDLWVTVSGGRNGGSKHILQGLTGYARPGELLAIMGPSGCGKSTLLDTLAGRLSSDARKAGEIRINGQRQALAYGTSAYVTQDDMLIATLTVREAIHYSAQLQLPATMSEAEKRERADTTIREMGLEGAADTRIGGTWGGGKGLSGGQKRRVSICLEMLKRPKLLFLDEPTSGLDSAASYYVMSQIARLTKRVDTGCTGLRTVIASIHQPSSEVFQLFDNLCLLSAGRTVFFGPTRDAKEFFALNGFPCPALQNPSDHFLKTINKDFDTAQDIESGSRSKPTAQEAIDTLTRSYSTSSYFRGVQREVARICKEDADESRRIVEKGRNNTGFFTQCSVLTRRSSLNMCRDVGYYWMRLAVYIALTVGLGTIFYDIGSSYGSIQARGSLLMFVATFLTYMSIGGFPSFVEEMKVFSRERLNGHYGSTAFVVSNTLSSTPYLLAISLIPGIISYYLPGLHAGFDRFVYYMLVLFVSMLLVESLMMIVAGLVPNYLMGIIVGTGIQGLMILGGGFFRLPDDLPKPFWKYPLYYIAFHKYAYEGMFKNEFEGLVFPGPAGSGGTTIGGDQILRDVWEVDMGYSKWVDLAVLIGMVLAYRLMFLAIIKTNEVVRPKVAALMASVRPKQSIQIMETPSSGSGALELE